MLQLFIDTASERSILGLAYAKELIAVLHLPVGLQNSKILFPALLELLQNNRLSPKEIQLIGCGIGPGSYTGIRVGAAIAQSMAYALRLPLVGYPSTEGFVPAAKGSYAVVFDAKVSGFYVQRGYFDGKASNALSEPEIVSAGEFPTYIRDSQIIVSPHVAQVQQKIAQTDFWQWEETSPSGQTIAETVFDRYQKGEFCKEAQLKLLYLRKTQCEIERDQIKKIAQ